MLNTIKAFFDTKLQINEEEYSEHIHLAAAALLIEMTLVDDQVKESETQALLNILTERFSIPKNDLDELVRLAKDEVKEATSLYQFTRLINDNYQDSDKFQLIQSMWEVAYADNELDKHEEALIRKVAELIYLPQSQFIKAKKLAQLNK